MKSIKSEPKCSKSLDKTLNFDPEATLRPFLELPKNTDSLMLDSLRTGSCMTLSFEREVILCILLLELMLLGVTFSGEGGWAVSGLSWNVAQCDEYLSLC